MIDVIITSTCRKSIVTTMESFHRNISYSGNFRFLVNIDVINNSDYLPELMSFLNDYGIDDIAVNRNPLEWPKGLTAATNYLYSKVESKYYFNLQDDWIFLKKINIDPLIELMDTHEDIHHIRFDKQRTRNYSWLYHKSDRDIPEFRKPNVNVNINNMKLVTNYVWSFNPSFSRTSTMKKFLPVPAEKRAETYFCSKFDELFSANGAFIYGRIGDNPTARDIGRNRLIEYLRHLKKML